MKPNNIFLVRHGESVGNVDKNIYAHTPDWLVPLTDKGKQQAEEAAQELLPKLCNDAIIYCSPWTRAKQTAEPLRNLLGCTYLEDPRIREQDWGNFQPRDDIHKYAKERDRFGTFFYRLPNGESGADVYDRISTFLETLYRDFDQEDYPKNVVIFSHGLTIRCFLMRFFHLSVEEYESMRNPKNCAIIQMALNSKGRYELLTKQQKYGEKCRK
jgi:broad specificity phosphatase PhoE